MSEKYGSHKEWTFGMECELPYKVCFALDKSPDPLSPRVCPTGLRQSALYIRPCAPGSY